MITAKNYAAQAVLAANNAIPKLLSKGNPRTELLVEFSKKASIAQHFATPEGGTIFDDNLRGIVGQDVKLPFPLITVEYYWEGTKQCILAEQDSSGDNNEIRFIIAFCDKGSDWDFFSSRAFFNGAVEESNLRVYFEADFCEPSYESQQQVSLRVLRVLELCEALSCANVTHEPIEKINPAVNARRVREGKLPLYETRCLVIHAGKSSPSKTANQHGNHNSPRQHLRRGHIRRLDSGNVWVNSCVVGDRDKGFIDKEYKVRR